MDIGVGSDTGSERAGEARHRTRDRRGRGMRGPGVVPARPGTTALRTARQRFDQLIGDYPQSRLAGDARKISDALAKAGG